MSSSQTAQVSSPPSKFSIILNVAIACVVSALFIYFLYFIFSPTTTTTETKPPPAPAPSTSETGIIGITTGSTSESTGSIQTSGSTGTTSGSTQTSGSTSETSGSVQTVTYNQIVTEGESVHLSLSSLLGTYKPINESNVTVLFNDITTG